MRAREREGRKKAWTNGKALVGFSRSELADSLVLRESHDMN